ncbi:MAG: DUF4422 domain-containing protein [Bacteroidales bacterium]|nr:DUF4422 domain-containing protein [Bacteroidales bacterium]
MGKQKITIFVACHKPVDVISNDVYKPIHVGRSISKYRDEMSYMIGDDTGDNISEKNPYYSEMTAQYWAWKNYHDTEYIGFCHYRRFFKNTFTNNNIDKILKGNDVIMVGPSLRIHNRINYLKNFVCGEDIMIFVEVLSKLYPDYYYTLLKYSNNFIDYPLNMFICKKTVFDKYAQWIFNILFECEKYIKLSPYSRGRRVFGYISEFLMPVYFMHNNYKIVNSPYYLPEKKIIIRFDFIHQFAYYFLRTLYCRFSQCPDSLYDIAIKLGLKNDGILINA